MNDEACSVFQDLINLAVRMMPIFMCMEPKHKNKENIAAVSAYLWVLMVSMESVFHIDPRAFLTFRGIFSCLFFLVLLVFFKGGLLKKAFLYISAWLFAVLSLPLNEIAARALAGRTGLTLGQIGVIVSLIFAAGFCLFVRFWLKSVVEQLFSQLSNRSGTLLLTYPSVSLVILFIGINTIFSPRSLAGRGMEDVLFFMALCAMILVLYVMILSSTLEIVGRRKTEEELRFARQLISQQREHYNQTLDYIEQVRIIRHDFRHHIHALLNMDKEDQTRYLQNLQRELDTAAEMVFCQNQSVNGLLQEYAARARQDGVEFEARLDLSARVPVDDLTLCIVIGNLLENALEACRRLRENRFIHLQARWMEDHMMMMVENSYNGQIKQSGGKILSSKKDGGLGMMCIRRILSRPWEEFDVCYNENTFTAMVKIMDRTIPENSA